MAKLNLFNKLLNAGPLLLLYFLSISDIDTNLENLIYKLDRQFLHAQTLGFIHPRTNEEMTFTSILPQELENILVLLRNTGK